MDKKWGYIIGILLFAFLIRLIFLFKNPALWWDTTVYIGIAKYIFSLGKIGLWEYFRPLLWPVILGIGWKLKADTLLFGRIMEILFTLAIIFFTFEITRKLFSTKIAIFSSLFLAVDPLIFSFAHILNNEIPSLFFGLFALYLFILYRENKSKSFLIISAVLAGASFLIRFPSGLFFGAMFVFLLAEMIINHCKKNYTNYKDFLIFTLSFIISIIPFFVFNYFFYNGDFLYPIKGASKIIKEITITAPELNLKWYYYFTMLFKNSFIFIFAAIGIAILIYYIFKKFKFNKKPILLENKLLLIILFALFFIYYQCVSFKDLRYAISYIPILYVFSIYGLHKLAKIKTIVPKIIIIIIILTSFTFSINASYKFVKYLPETPSELMPYYTYFSSHAYYQTTVISTTPILISYSDIDLIPFYTAGARKFDTDLEHHLNTQKPEYVVFSTSDIPCSDNLCFEKRTKAFNMIKKRFEQVFYLNYNDNEYFIFRTGLRD